jgi:hypothetical protein
MIPKFTKFNAVVSVILYSLIHQSVQWHMQATSVACIDDLLCCITFRNLFIFRCIEPINILSEFCSRLLQLFYVYSHLQFPDEKQ